MTLLCFQFIGTSEVHEQSVHLNLNRFLRAGILQIVRVELVTQIIHVSHLFIICSVKQIFQSLYSSE